jgi:hypothetical protein
MSHRLVTLDTFMTLEIKDVATALRLLQQEIAGTFELIRTNPEAAQDQVVLDELTSLLTLRKVFKGRLAELEEEEGQEAPVLASERFLQNAQEPALV